MKVNMKKLDGNQVLLECQATADEVNRALQNAQIGFAQQMGLHPEQGKTVSQVAEEKMGIKNLDSIVESSAIESLVPYALDKKNLIPSFPPSAEPKTPFKRGRQFTFNVTVDLKPEYELSSYDPVEITVPPFSVDEEAVDAQIAEMAERYTTYVAADPKPVEKGDSCLIAMKCFENGEELKGLTTDGRTYTAGEGYMPPSFDEHIIGMKPGETKNFVFEGPSVDENYNEITQVIDATVTLLEMARRFEWKTADEVYESMRANLLENLRAELQQQGKTWEQFIDENGGEQQAGMMLMMQTRELLVQGFALDAVFRHEHLTLTDHDIEAACYAMNPNIKPKQLRQQLEQSGRGFALRESAERLKANQWVLDHAIIHVAES